MQAQVGPSCRKEGVGAGQTQLPGVPAPCLPVVSQFFLGLCAAWAASVANLGLGSLGGAPAWALPVTEAFPGGVQSGDCQRGSDWGGLILYTVLCD